MLLFKFILFYIYVFFQTFCTKSIGSELCKVKSLISDIKTLQKNTEILQEYCLVNDGKFVQYIKCYLIIILLQIFKLLLNYIKYIMKKNFKFKNNLIAIALFIYR